MEKTNNNSQDNSKSISYTMSDQLVSALRSNMKEFKEALVKRRDEVIVVVVAAGSGNFGNGHLRVFLQ